MTKMPAAFFGHGSPMNALETNLYTEAWADYGRSLPRPTAILAISAHWFVNATAVTSAERPALGFRDLHIHIDGVPSADQAAMIRQALNGRTSQS